MGLPPLFILLLVTSANGIKMGHSLFRRAIEDLQNNASMQSAQNTTGLNDPDDSGPFMTKNKFGFQAVQYNNPDLPGEKRQMQALDSPLFTGICNPDQVYNFRNTSCEFSLTCID